jgi:cytochrome c2
MIANPALSRIFCVVTLSIMNQQKYIMSAILLIVVGAAIYFGIKEFPQGKDIVNSSNKIDYDNPIDSLTETQLDGKRIFQSKCASCHLVFKNATGPALSGVTKRGPWSDSIKLYLYIRKPESFSQSKYIDSLRKMYGFNHMAFPDLTDEEISAILRYINVQYKIPVVDIVD